MSRSNKLTAARWWRHGVVGLILTGLALTGLSVLPTLAQSGDAGGNVYILNKARSKILFSIGHFVVSSTEGQFTVFDGKLNFQPQAPDHGTVTIHVSPGSINTGIAARDDHLRTADFFDAAKYPVAVFESTNAVQDSAKTGKLTGTFSLHGVTKPVTLNVTLLSPDLNADRLDFSANTVLKRSDYGMTNYMGMIGDDVTLTIQAEFDKQR